MGVGFRSFWLTSRDSERKVARWEGGKSCAVGLEPGVVWQRAKRRRAADVGDVGDAPLRDEPFWKLLVDATEALSDFEEPRALELLEQATPHCPESGALRAAYDETLGEVRFLLNDYPGALEAFQRAQAAWSALNEPLAEAETRGWWGACLVQQGRYRDGYEQLHAAVDAFEREGQPSRAARALNYLAVIHEELGDYARAFEVYERAHDAALRDGDADMQGRVLANHGEAFVACGQPERGLPVLSRAVDVLRGVGAHWHYGWCLLAIGRIHYEWHDEVKALDFHRRALDAVEKGHSPRARVEIYAGLGSLLSKLAQHDEAKQWLEKALTLARQVGVQREVFKTHKLLSEAFKRAGDFERALEHHEQFHEIRAAVFDALARERVATLRAEFELQRVTEAAQQEQKKHRELTQAYAQLEEHAATLTHLSTRDGLTGLYNRRRFDELLRLELERAQGYGHPLTLLLLDIDFFKRINDTFSHVAGDGVLQAVAQVLTRELRASDFAARYGGEEFALLLPHTALEGGRIVAEKVRLAIATTSWVALTPGHQVTTSIGLAQWAPGMSPTELVRQADAGLYAAKGAGRNRVRAG